MLRIISLNLNGIRSAWSKNVLPWAVAQQADVFCLQEIKCHPGDVQHVAWPPKFHRSGNSLPRKSQECGTTSIGRCEVGLLDSLRTNCRGQEGFKRADDIEVMLLMSRQMRRANNVATTDQTDARR